MKITKIESIPLNKGPMLVMVHTDEGITGIGEVSGWGELPKAIKTFIDEFINPLIVGRNPRNTNALWEEMFFNTARLGPMGMQTTGIGAVDIACWDILGKSVGMPLHQLLGGAARTRIKVYLSVGAGCELQPLEMLEKIEAGYEAGFRAFKVRLEWTSSRQDVDPAKDLEMYRLCREFLPADVYLGLDVNNGYSVSTAIEQGKRLEEVGIDHLEEPLPEFDYQGLRQVADALTVPVSSGEQEYTRWQFRDLILNGNPDILQPDIVSVGGFSEMRRICTLAETFNKPVMPHCPSAGIASAASLHLYSTLRYGTRPHEYSKEEFTFNPEIESLLEEPLEVKDGEIELPSGPGLGLAIDENVLERVRV